MDMATHPSVLAAASTGTVIALAATQTDVPWWLWTAWAALTVLGVGQAVRDARAGA